MHRILVVDDEASLNQLIATNLMLEGFDVESAACGAEALERLETFAPDLVLLDVMMPDLDGFEVLRRIRLQSSVGVIMLTARAQTKEKVEGLQLGADDYVAKPFSFSELLARIQAVLRRSAPASLPPHAVPASDALHEEPDLRSASIVCRPSEHRVTVLGQETVLQNLEFKLLVEFLRAPGRVLTHDYLLQAAWPPNEGDVTTLRVAIGKLRAKLRAASGRDFLDTVHGLGYRFTDHEA